jgi:hypothetical protein
MQQNSAATVAVKDAAGKLVGLVTSDTIAEMMTMAMLQKDHAGGARGGAARAACGDLTDIQETSVLKRNHPEAGVGIIGLRTVAAAHPRVASSRRSRWTVTRLAPAQAQ